MVEVLIISWLLAGLVAEAAGWLGWLSPITSIVLFFPLVTLVGMLFRYRQIIPLSLGLIWLLHAVGIVIPETGFDALWYHLPIAKRFSELHLITYWSKLYQSVNPLFSDLVFTLGFQVAGDLGTKLVAYGFALSLVVVTYALTR